MKTLLAKEFQACRGRPSPPPEPDGFFVSILMKGHEGYKKWLLESPLQEDLKRALRNGDLLVGERSLIRAFMVVPYWVKNREALPAKFHDTGEAYLRTAEDELVSHPVAPEYAAKEGAARYAFHWNECPSLNPYCGTGAIVTAREERPATWAFNVRILGSTISQTSPWIVPHWTASWRRPYLEVTCGRGKIRRVLADSVGYEEGYGYRAGYPFDFNNSFVAPFERTVHVRCPGRPKAIAVGREATAVDQLTKVKLLPARRLELPF
jgi:hypothetical protein